MTYEELLAENIRLRTRIRELEQENARLQNLFRMIGLGDNLGSGFPTILSAWKAEKWKRPDLQEDYDLRQVDLKLWMVSLFPPEAIEYMRNLLGDKFDTLLPDEQAILVTAYLEDEVSSPRIQTLLDKNVLEVGKLLFHLTNLGYLQSSGRGRGTIYSVPSEQLSNINEGLSNTNGGVSNINENPSTISEDAEGPFRVALLEHGQLAIEDSTKKRNVRYIAINK